MRKILILAIVILISLSTKAQVFDQQPNSITVTGSSIIKREVVAYRSKITLNMEQVYYANPDCQSLQQLKEVYFEKVEKKGLNPLKFKEDKFEFSTYGYNKDGTILVYETTSKSEIEKLASIRLTGVSVQQSFKFEMSEERRQLYLENALKSAETNAKRISAITGLEIKEIASISESSPLMNLWKNHHQDYDEYITVQVTYSFQ